MLQVQREGKNSLHAVKTQSYRYLGQGNVQGDEPYSPKRRWKDFAVNINERRRHYKGRKRDNIVENYSTLQQPP